MSLANTSRELARWLKQSGLKVVFAESCTGGLVSATLAAIPGISAHLCGSAVTYRNDTKHQWLNVPNNMLRRFGAVSPEVAQSMATKVLAHTPEADWSAAVTGHVGPDAPPGLDGCVYIGVARRKPPAARRPAFAVAVTKHQLAVAGRVPRQRAAATLVLRELVHAIEAETSTARGS